MISKEVESALNNQINRELYSGYLYLSMSAYFEKSNLKGMAVWMRMQAEEEYSHAMKIFDFINERGGEVVLEPIEKPEGKWKSPLEIFEDSYEHERNVTESIYSLVDLAREKGDKATEIFLGWFVTEQVEEEASVSEVVEKLRAVKDSPAGVFMIDAHLGRRGKR